MRICSFYSNNNWVFRHDNRVIYHGIFPIVSRDLWLEHVTTHCTGITGLEAENAGLYSARLSWSGAGGHGLYEVSVGPADSAVETYTTFSTSDTSLTFSEMEYGVKYAFLVRGRCSYEDTILTWSQWSDSVQFQRPGFQLSLLTNNGLWGTVTGSGLYEPYSDVSFEATPAENCLFLGWSDSILDNPRTITITQDTAFRALFDLNIGIDEALSTPHFQMTVTPNPATGKVEIGAEGIDGTADIEIADLSGRLLYRSTFNPAQGPLTLDVSAYLPGAYTVRLRTSSHVATQKMIVK